MAGVSSHRRGTGPSPHLDKAIAACALQRAARSMLQHAQQRNRSRVAELLRSKRRERVGPPPSAPSPPAASCSSTSSAADGYRPVFAASGTLEERQAELMRLIKAERERVAELQRTTGLLESAEWDGAGMDAAGVPPGSPPGNARPPALEAPMGDQSPAVDLFRKAGASRQPAGRSATRGSHRVSLEEFRQLEAECEAETVGHGSLPRLLESRAPSLPPTSDSRRGAPASMGELPPRRGAALPLRDGSDGVPSAPSVASSVGSSSVSRSQDKLASILAYLDEVSRPRGQPQGQS